MSLTKLKIKSKHLALEPAIIRHEERKLQARAKYLRTSNKFEMTPDHLKLIGKLEHERFQLYSHRTNDVRNEARATYLAIAFIKGKPYTSVEPKRKNESHFYAYILDRIFSMVAKYGNKPIYKCWNGKNYDYKPEEKKELMDQIKTWAGL